MIRPAADVRNAFIGYDRAASVSHDHPSSEPSTRPILWAAIISPPPTIGETALSSLHVRNLVYGKHDYRTKARSYRLQFRHRGMFGRDHGRPCGPPGHTYRRRGVMDNGASAYR